MGAAAEKHAEVVQITLGGMAREALGRNDGIVNAAVADVARRLRSDRALMRVVIEQAVQDALQYRAQSAVRHERHAIIQRATNERANVLALARGLSASLLDMPLAGGIRLRSCDRAFVQQEADRFDGLSRETARKARFLALIAQSVPDGKVVGDVLDDARALELWTGAA